MSTRRGNVKIRGRIFLLADPSIKYIDLEKEYLHHSFVPLLDGIVHRCVSFVVDSEHELGQKSNMERVFSIRLACPLIAKLEQGVSRQNHQHQLDIARTRCPMEGCHSAMIARSDEVFHAISKPWWWIRLHFLSVLKYDTCCYWVPNFARQMQWSHPEIILCERVRTPLEEEICNILYGNAHLDLLSAIGYNR
jgi:hypothetical protein